MRKFSLFTLLAIMLLAVGCESEMLDQEIHRPVIKDGQASITIMGDSMITTRSTNGRVESPAATLPVQGCMMEMLMR